MDWLTFLATIIGHLAWPGVVGVLLVIIRRQLVGLAERIEEVALPGGASAKFSKAVAAGRAELEQVAVEKLPTSKELVKPSDAILKLAGDFPEAAVLEAYRELERVLIEIRHRLDLNTRMNLPSVIRQLVVRGLADAEVEPLFNSVRIARNAAAHGGGSNRIGPGEAVEYIQQVSFLRTYFGTVQERLPPAGS